jgi:hypothetical protein
MVAVVVPMGYLYDISGTTSEVKIALVANKITSVEGYFVDTATGKRYILGKR